MPIDLDRRRTLAGLAAGTAFALTGAASTRLGASEHNRTFAHGVASGDPTADSVVLWTRVSGLGVEQSVQWELSEYRDFRRIAGGGEAAAGPDRDFTVKVVVTGLTPGQRYYYRFRLGDQFSESGRTRTLPRGAVSSLGFAIASCSNYPFGYFNAYEAMALDPTVDFVLHLGDYLYEYGASGWGAATGAHLGRLHVPAGEIITLADYRTRHAQYKADPQSRQLHAAHPMIPVWDDHESANNPWVGGAENHQPGREGSWRRRRAAALKAWYEWMPVRDPAPGQNPGEYWRSFAFGDLATLVTLETRHSARAQQIEYDDYPGALANQEAADHFLRNVVGAPERPMLAPAMETLVMNSLAASVRSGQPWRLIGNPYSYGAHGGAAAERRRSDTPCLCGARTRTGTRGPAGRARRPGAATVSRSLGRLSRRP